MLGELASTSKNLLLTGSDENDAGHLTSTGC
jgi:hypothetical protein